MKHIFIMAIAFSMVIIPFPTKDLQSESIVISKDHLVELSYSSRCTVTTILESGDTAWGDHVLLNATYLLGVENVTSSQLSILTEENENYTIDSYNHTISYDTYYIGKNTTASIYFRICLENGTVLQFDYEEITIQNFFSPEINAIDITGSGTIKTISWTVADLNADDCHLFDIYLKYEDCSRWWLLVSNISGLSYEWDWSYYSSATWQVKLVCFDNDPLFRPNHLNQNIWPALRDEHYSNRFGAYSESMGPDLNTLPGKNVSIILLESSNYTEGDTGNEIRWYKRVSMFHLFPDLSNATYSIYRNGIFIEAGSISYGHIDIMIDGLSPGLYNYTLYITHKAHSASNTVVVQVRNLVKTLSDFLLPSFVITLVLFSLGVIVVMIREPIEL